MHTLQISDEAYARLRLASLASGRSESDILIQILDWVVFGTARPAGLEPAAEPTPTPSGMIEVYFLHKGERTEGEFDPGTGAITVTSGPLARQHIKSPSGAGYAIKKARGEPDTACQTDGYMRWRVTSTDKQLQSIRGEHLMRNDSACQRGKTA